MYQWEPTEMLLFRGKLVAFSWWSLAEIIVQYLLSSAQISRERATTWAPVKVTKYRWDRLIWFQVRVYSWKNVTVLFDQSFFKNTTNLKEKICYLFIILLEIITHDSEITCIYSKSWVLGRRMLIWRILTEVKTCLPTLYANFLPGVTLIVGGGK